MTLNLSKTWETLIHGKTTKPNPQPLPGIERKSWFKLLGIIFQENPCCWDLHVDKLIAKASSRLYILRVCKFMVILKINLISYLTPSCYPYLCMAYRFGDLPVRSIWIELTTSGKDPTDMVIPLGEIWDKMAVARAH